MIIKATQKYLVTSPKKMREIVYMIKGLTPKQALERLPFVERRGAKTLEKVIHTAVANARVLGVADDTLLVFKEIQINEGSKLKRWRAGARGRAKPYRRKMSHIRVVLESKELPKATVKKSIKKQVLTNEDKKGEVSKKKA